MSVVRIANLRCELGESPVWDELRNRLLMLDIDRRQLISIRDGKVDGAPVDLSERVTAIVPSSAGWLAVFGRSIGLLDPDSGRVDAVIRVPGSDDLMLNDAVAGRDGRLYVGSVDRSGSRRGEVYALNEALSISIVVSGISASNGLDTTSDGTTLVYVDSLGDQLTWGVGGQDIKVPHPDGLALDAEGYAWVALWGHGEVRRIDRHGAIERTVALPTQFVTNVAFGGPDLGEMFITTARSDHDGGEVYRLRPGVTGLTPAVFRWAPTT